MISKTATIGIAPLVNALKIQNNHYRYDTVRRINPLASGCYSCPYYNTDPEKCNECSSKIHEYEQIRTYVNEKNRYGDKNPLKLKTLETFLYLHFQHPDKKGLVSIEVSEAAKTIGCTNRTIRNNLRLLQDYNYIVYGKGQYPGNYLVFINNYEKNFLSAKEGGRGFITISDDIFHSFLKAETINELRITLRSYIECVSTEHKNIVNKQKTYNHMKEYLPSYCTNKEIRNVFRREPFSTLFEHASNHYTYFCKLKADYQPAALVRKIKENCTNEIRPFIIKLNEQLDKDSYPPFLLDPDDYKDISNIATQYHVNDIKKAIQEIFDTYILQKLPVKKMGALVRSVCQANEFHKNLVLS